MDKQIVFKTSAFGGFEKKAVLDYVYQLNEDAESTQAQLRQQLDAASEERRALGEERDRLSERVKTLQQSLDNANAELVGERARVSELGNLGEGLQEELERERGVLRERERELALLREENQTLSAQNSEYSAKQQEIDETVSRIGQLMLAARSDADAMLKQAQGEAAQRIREGAEQAARLEENAKAEAEALELRAKEEAQALEQRVNEETSALEQRVKEETETLEREARERADAALRDAESRSRNLLEEAERRVAEMQEQARLSLGGVSGRMEGFCSEMAQVQGMLSQLLHKLEDRAGEVKGAAQSASGLLADAARALEEDLSRPVSESEEASDPEQVDPSFFRTAAEV